MSLWNGRFRSGTDQRAALYSASIDFDKRLYKQDIEGSIAHAEMLVEADVITSEEAEMIKKSLRDIETRIEKGVFQFDHQLEDIHMNIEQALINDIGEVGAKLHSGRSRNDQIATDERLYLREANDRLSQSLQDLQTALFSAAERFQHLILPGFTHLQHAQPVPLAHHLLAYVEMFERDRQRLTDTRQRINVLPLGSGALAGSTLPLNRQTVADKLGFDSLSRNSMDAVSDRDYIIETLSALAIIAMHCSRLAEDIIIWASQEFAFIELDDAFCTGSSLMPQKKNPDLAELSRGKTGRVYGALVGALTLMKGLPMTYNRDLQEDKEGLFDALDTVGSTLEILAPMISSARFNGNRMREAAQDPALMATDLAEWLVNRKVPFREAHRQVGRLVGYCREKGRPLNRITLEEMRLIIPSAEEECLNLFDPQSSIDRRDLPGGAAMSQVQSQLRFWRQKLT